MPEKEILLSVCMITYKHEQFIQEALESILMQITDFEFEVIVANDCSPDNTDEIVCNLIKTNPHGSRIKYYSRETNLGPMSNFINAVNNCKGKYIALCEGDDYWTDPYKLQKQVDFLNANPDVVLSSGNGLVKNWENNTESLFNKETHETYYSAYELLQYRRFPTASVVFRSKYLNEIVKLKYVADTILWVFLSTKGKVHYSPIVSSVYNKGRHGLVLGTDRLQWAKITERWDKQTRSIIEKSQIKDTFDFSIFNDRIYNEYYRSYHSYKWKKSPKQKLLCYFGCIKIKPKRMIKIIKKEINDYIKLKIKNI